MENAKPKLFTQVSQKGYVKGRTRRLFQSQNIPFLAVFVIRFPKKKNNSFWYHWIRNALKLSTLVCNYVSGFQVGPQENVRKSLKYKSR